MTTLSAFALLPQDFIKQVFFCLCFVLVFGVFCEFTFTLGANEENEDFTFSKLVLFHKH